MSTHPRPARLTLDDMDEAASVMRASFDQRLPGLAGLHTPAEDREFFRNHLFRTGELWGCKTITALVGIIAFRPGWIDQLYVLPTHQSLGVGTALLAVAKAAHPRLSLWAFQQNHHARRFYELHGFVVRERTDGADNEEKAPDIRYEWLVGGDGFEPPTLSV